MMKHNKLMQITISLVISLLFLSGVCLAGFFKMAGASMEPTLKAGQRVWVSSYAKNTGPARGDIIVFRVEKSTYLKKGGH